MTYPRDFLQASPSPGPAKSPDAAARYWHAMDENARLLRELIQLLLKQNPGVKATTVVEGTDGGRGSNVITDTLPHQVYFEIGGKRVPVYKTLIFSTYTETVTIHDEPVSNNLTGIRVLAGDVLINAFEGVGQLNIKANALANSQLIVNGSADSAEGAIYIYGWTNASFQLSGNELGV